VTLWADHSHSPSQFEPGLDHGLHAPQRWPDSHGPRSHKSNITHIIINSVLKRFNVARQANGLPKIRLKKATSPPNIHANMPAELRLANTVCLAIKFCLTKTACLDYSKIHLIKAISNTKKWLHWEGHRANEIFKLMLLFWFQCICIYWESRESNKQSGLHSQLLLLIRSNMIIFRY